MLDRTFPIAKNHELSSLEARIESIRRRLTNPLGRRNSLEKGGIPATSRGRLAAMPRNRRPRRKVNGDFEASGAEESYENGSGGDNPGRGVDAGGVSEHGDGNGSDHTDNHASGRRPRQSKGGSTVQHKQLDLGPWSEAVGETVQSMGAAHRAIKDLQDKFKLHIDDLAMIEEMRDRLDQLEETCKERGDEIKVQENAITTLRKIDAKSKITIEHEKAVIEKGKQALEEEKIKLGKRVTTMIAEERHKLEDEVERCLAGHRQSHDKRMKELEDEFARQRDKNNGTVTALEADNERLLATVEEQERTIEAQQKELAKNLEQYDVVERAKDSFKADMLAREAELKAIKKEFALSSRSTDYFKQKFAEIHHRIEGISLKYVHGIEGKDLEKVQDELVAADTCFSSFLIEDSDDSRKLCTVHAQRIISGAICGYIWKPFGSELTLAHPEFNSLLSKIFDELDNSSHNRRATNVWTALTMQALQSLPATSPSPRVAGSKKRHHPTGLGRAERVVSKVLSVLSPLINSAQKEEFCMDLLALATSAINIWNDAHTGELKITIRPSLERTNREEWRSQMFDPVSPSGDDGEAILDEKSRTHPRIFTLFPRVIARGVVDPAKHGTGPPGSWTPESDQAPRTIETCIHPGRGLPESSSLVVRGKAEQEEKHEYLSKVLEKAKKEMHSTRRMSGHFKRESIGSSTSGPPSPSEQWKTEGAMTFLEA